MNQLREKDVNPTIKQSRGRFALPLWAWPGTCFSHSSTLRRPSCSSTRSAVLRGIAIFSLRSSNAARRLLEHQLERPPLLEHNLFHLGWCRDDTPNRRLSCGWLIRRYSQEPPVSQDQHNEQQHPASHHLRRVADSSASTAIINGSCRDGGRFDTQGGHTCGAVSGRQP